MNPSSPDASPTAPKYAFSLIPGSKISNYPYLLINCNQYFKIAPDTKKPRKILIDAPDTDETDVADEDYADSPNATDNYSVFIDSKTPINN